MRVAVVGAGVAGLVCASLLHRVHEVTVFEASPEPGGHSHTVRVALDDADLQVDTGFIVYNERNYPLFTALLARLGVKTQASDMSFSVSYRPAGLEYRPGTLGSLFAQRARTIDPSFQRMLVDIVRFNRAARRALAEGDERPLGELLGSGRFGRRLRRDFVVPLGSSIWSADPAHFEEMPLESYARFMGNHGLLSFGDQPAWRTVSGGSARYVEALSRPFARAIRRSSPVDKLVRREGRVELHLAGGGLESFDRVVLATHSDQALALLSDPTPEEHAVLSAIRYQENRATLHTDRRLLPRSPRAWASWNYHVLDRPKGRATLSYHMNRLQSLPTRHQVLVSLNMEEEVDESQVLGSFTYAHPVLDRAAVAAQARRTDLQGTRGTYYCGAYWGYGFHEDGVRSAVDVAGLLGTR